MRAGLKTFFILVPGSTRLKNRKAEKKQSKDKYSLSFI
jgi:hypothetical protein